MADRGDEGAMKQAAPPEVEIVVDSPATKSPIPSQEAGETQKVKHARVDEIQSEEKAEQLQKREMEEADGSSVPAKYAEAVLTVDDKQR